MTKFRVNLNFDGNYLLHKNVFTLHKINTLYGDLYNALTNNIEKYIAMHSWDNIFIISDSKKKSWRKQTLDTYKATRVKPEDIDWDFVFETYETWKKDMSEKYNVLEADHIEGDDWITSIVRKTNIKGYSNVVISSDCDMNQLLGYRLHSSGKTPFINMQINDHTGKEKIFLPEGWELYKAEIGENINDDVFALDNSASWADFFVRLTDNWTVEEVNPTEVLFVKLVSGDKSDNIKSIYQTVVKSGKIQEIGEAGALKIWNFYKDNYGLNVDTKSEELRGDIVNCLERVKKLDLTEQRRSDVVEKINRNISIIELHHRHFPEWVSEAIIDKLSEITIN